MEYLLVQLFFWLLGAFVVGVLIGWWLKARLTSQVMTQVHKEEHTPRAVAAAIISEHWAPDGLHDSEVDDPDDLKRINGISSKVEVLLNTVGIYYFEQVAALTSNNIAWINDKLDFGDRIEREEWVAQARALSGR